MARFARNNCPHIIHLYADRHGIGQSTVYFRIKKLAEAIQLHPWFEEITAPFRPVRTAA